MKPTRDAVLKHFIEVLESLDEDGEIDQITEETHLLGSMNWRSIEIVYLANAMQEHYGRTFPFNDLFEEIGKRELQDISVGEWVDFIHTHLGATAADSGAAAETATN